MVMTVPSMVWDTAPRSLARIWADRPAGTSNSRVRQAPWTRAVGTVMVTPEVRVR